MSIPNTSRTDTLDTFRNNVNTDAINMGDLASLTTTDQTSIVNAINEIDALVASGIVIRGGTVGGTGDAITLTPSPAIAAYSANMMVVFTATAANTGATTVQISGLPSPKAIKKNTSDALVANDITSGQIVLLTYDGTNFQYTPIGYVKANSITVTHMTNGVIPVLGGTVGGTADAITLTPSPAITAYVTNQKYTFIAASANTGAVTVQISGLASPVPVKKNTNVALVANDITAGQEVELIYDGTNFQYTPIGFVKDSSITATHMTNGTIPINCGTATGVDTITLTPSPAITAYVSGQIYTFKTAGANTGAVTVQISGLASPVPVKKNTSLALVAGDFQSGQMVSLIHDGTNFQWTEAGIGNLSNLNTTDKSSAVNAINETFAAVSPTTGVVKGIVVGGTGDAITLTPSPAIASYVLDMLVTFVASAANTGAVTVQISGLASPVPIKKNTSDALVANDITSGQTVILIYDGTNFQYTPTGYIKSGSIVNANINASAAIDATKIADGSISNTEFQYLNNVASNVQIQLNKRGQFKNKIIGGNFDTNPWQRGTSFASQGSGQSGTLHADRFVINIAGVCVATIAQIADAPSVAQCGYNVSNCYSWQITTADASVAAGDYAMFDYKIEGYNFASLANGRTLTLSFWHKHTITGTYCVGFLNSAQNRNYIAEYTQAVADTWEKATITLTSDTSGTWLYTTGVGLLVRFALMTGSSFQGTANTWQAGNLWATSNQANGVSSISNFCKFALIQLEAGSDATDFEFRDVGTELELCLRYYNANIFPGATPVGQANGSSGLEWWAGFPVPMRVFPSANHSTGGTLYYCASGSRTSLAIATATIVISSGGTNGAYFTGSGWSGVQTIGFPGQIQGCVVSLSAEL